MKYSFLGLAVLLLFVGCSTKKVGSVPKEVEEENETIVVPEEKNETIVVPEEKNETIVVPEEEEKTEKEAVFKLDTGGHSALIRKILVTKSGDLISASDDKTVRVCDSKTGREKRKILGKIGEGMEGMIYAIALSPDEKFLAVGGYFEEASKNANLNHGQIRIYDFQTGKLLQILKSHKNAVSDLAFSIDGKYLASGSADKTAKIWELSHSEIAERPLRSEWRLKTTISFHTDFVYGVVFVPTLDSSLRSEWNLATASYDNRVALHTLSGKKVGEYQHSQTLKDIATNGEDIATCGKGNEILIFDKNLNLKKKILSETVPVGLAFSPDGKKLISGRGSTPNNVNIYETNNYSKIASFQKHTNATQAVNFLDNSTAVSGGGSNNEIYIWNAVPGVEERKIIGGGEIVWSVGVSGDMIGWGNVFDAIGDYHTNRSTLRRYFNLKTFEFDSRPPELVSGSQIPKQVRHDGAEYSLHHSSGGSYGYSDAVLEIRKNGKVVAKIVREGWNGYQHRTYGFWGDKIVSGGSHGHLKIYNLSGDEIANLVGHNGEVLSIALDGNRLVSGSSDQTVRIWDLKEIENYTPKKEVNEELISEAKKQLGWSREEVFKNEEMLKILGFSLYKITSETPSYSPQLSLLFTSENEWVAWTPENFYTSSKGGKSLLGFHINQGAEREAEYISADKLEEFYRPDLIAKALNGESLEEYAKNIDVNRILTDGLPPKLEIVSPSGKSKSSNFPIQVEVCEKDGGVGNFQILLNGVPIDKTRILVRDRSDEVCRIVKREISLQDGENEISVLATNSAGTIESERDTISISYSAPKVIKPNLYILAIGVNKYRDGDLWLNYAVPDVEAIVETLPKVSKKLFQKVDITKLLDSDVTKEKILDAFEEIGKKATPNDLFVFYIAGHGVTDKQTGKYFFIPYNFRYKGEESVRESAISQEDFSDGFAQIKTTKSLTMLDTCNSGSFAMNRGGFAQKTAIEKFVRATGRATIMASSKDQVAYEGYKGHGVFTFALLEKLQGDFGNDKKLTVRELSSHLEERVPELTFEKWGYEQLPNANMHGNDFPIGLK
jgi:WD40 repeat protein